MWYHAVIILVLLSCVCTQTSIVGMVSHVQPMYFSGLSGW